jgi:O-antigen/teichoic acid export membrane protein
VTAEGASPNRSPDASPDQPAAPSPSGEVGRFFRHSGVYAVGNALNRVGAFLLLPVYTQFLTVAQYGVLELYYAMAAVVAGVLSVGVAHATLRFYFDYETQPERGRLVSTNLIASLGIGTAGAATIAVLGGAVIGRFVPGIAPGPALYLVLATLVLEMGSQVCLAYVRAREKSTLFVMVALCKVVLQVLVNGALLVWYDAGVTGVLAGNLATVLMGFLFLAGYTLRHCGLEFEWKYLAPVLKYSLPFLFTTVLMVVASNIDRFLIGGLLALEALGTYALAIRFAALISDLVGEPFNRAYGAFRFTVMRRSDAAVLQADIVRYLLILLVTSGLGVIYFSGDVIRLLSNSDFWGAPALIPWLVLAAIFQVVTYPLQTGVLVQKETRKLFYISFAQAAVRLSVSYLFILRFGLQGACVAILLDAVLGMVLTHRASARYFPVRYDLRKIGILSALAVAFFVAAVPLLGQAGLAAFGAKVALYLTFILALFFSPVLMRSERTLARGAVLRFLGRNPGPSGGAEVHR